MTDTYMHACIHACVHVCMCVCTLYVCASDYTVLIVEVIVQINVM